MGIRLHDFRNSARFARVVRNPWQAARARQVGAPGEHLALSLRQGGEVTIRRRTSDIRVFRDVFVTDTYRLAALLAREGRRLDTVVDVGAHIGLVAVRVAPHARRVVCCEPTAANRGLLEHNLRTSGSGNVSVFAGAVAAKPGSVEIFRSRGNPGGHTMLSACAMHPIEPETEVVPALPLADLFAQHDVARCDLLKLDCEGAEYEILLGAGDDLLARVGRIALEYHDARAVDAGFTGEALCRRLERAGFAVERDPSRRHENQGMLFATRTR